MDSGRMELQVMLQDCFFRVCPGIEGKLRLEGALHLLA